MNFLWTKHELISATNGSDPSSNFLKNEDVVSGVSIDDRTIQKGDLFIAIKGDKFDGHDFIESAISKGASGVLVSEEQYALKWNALLVKDTKVSLKNIAQFSRNRFSGKVIAITGSSGKTSTKHILASSLQEYGNTHFTQGNNNNIIGLSLTLSRLPKEYKFCVLELGMNHSGEIKELALISRPDIALITNVSSSHIQNFKSEKEIANAKSEIFLGLNSNGIALINSDNLWSKYLKEKAEKITPNVYYYGHLKNSKTIVKKIIDEKDGCTIFQENELPWHLKYLNTVQASNAVASIAVVKELKLPEEIAKKTISNLKPLPGRGQKITINFKNNQKSLLIDDSYNANPDSMYASLSNLYKTKSKLHNYKTVLIIGDMLELGKKSMIKHLELIPIIKKINPNLLITVGFFTELMSKKLEIKSYSYPDIDSLILKIKDLIKPNQLILIKGSNGSKVWKLVKILQNLNQEKTNAA